MEIETKVISIETIKPSSPTPKSLQIHHLSILDQSAPPLYIPSVYYYASSPKIPNFEKSKQLKKSLSEVLSRFYPLAGRHVGNLYVDCNDDAGAPFFEAEADCDLSQAMPHANTKVLNHLLPYKMDELQHFCMAVQATYFRCGGLALGILVSHKIVDAKCFNMFFNTWSAVARNGDFSGVPMPEFEAAAYFPPLQDPSPLDTTAVITKEEVTCKIFTFSAATISLLRERYSGGGQRPSRTEALSAFIWTQYISAICTRSDPNMMFILLHAVDLRSRADPPLSQYSFGSIIGLSTTMVAAGDGCVEVVRKIREAVIAVNSDYVAARNKIESYQKLSETAAMVSVIFTFSSLCGFPLYEADFGWGRPVWVGMNQFPTKNTIFFMDTKSGGGIEAFVHLTKQDMEKFEDHWNLQQLMKSKL